MTCNCKFCQDFRAWDAIVKRGDVEEMKSLIYELRERLGNAEEKLGIDEAILNGSWPSAKQFAKLGMATSASGRRLRAETAGGDCGGTR